MNELSRIFVLVLMLTGLGGLQACSEQGPMEAAGEDLDDAIEEARDALDEATKEFEEACEDVTNSNC